ncbi:type II secretion system minor pseudopilin GspJ [Henriciella sp.]|uniref:type II secretion system minor pseudopilin GspJ n=1 Tax=Henriciella sp. TaxID=1968823 RepID=UPI002634D15C|nr:type II secretion system minor pseudopilin GspJ [Henriciella sp.]
MTGQDVHKGEGGFTLVETLVALLILSMLAAAGGALLLRATSSGEQLREREAEMRQMDIAQAFIRSDIENAVLRAVEPPEGYDGAMAMAGGETNRTDALLRLVRNGWMNPGGLARRSDLQPVSYDLNAEGELVRTAWIRPDATQSTPVAERVLLNGVESVEVMFWRDGEASTYWEGGPQANVRLLPDLIELRILFERGQVMTIAALVGGAGS